MKTTVDNYGNEPIDITSINTKVLKLILKNTEKKYMDIQKELDMIHDELETRDDNGFGN